MSPRLIATAVSLATLAITASAVAQETPSSPQANAPDDNDVIVTAQRSNRTEVTRGGQVGVLGDKPAADVPFSIRSYNAALILNQQPQTLGQLLQNDPSIRTTYGFGNAAEQFVIRGFTLFGDDIGFDGLYGITPRQLVAPELYDSVQVLNGASAFLNGAAPSGSGIGGSVNLVPKRAGADPLTRATVNYTSSTHVGGSFDVARHFGDLGVRINGAYRAGDVAIDNEFRRAAVLGGALDWSSGPVRLSLDLAYQRVQVRQLRPKVTVATTTVPAVPDNTHNYGQPFTYTMLRDIFGEARAEWDVAPNATLYAQVGARDGSEQGIYGGITVTDAATGAATGNALYVPRTDNNEAVQVGLRVKLAASGVTQEINVGGSYLWQVNRNAYDFRYGPGFTGFATNLYVTPAVPLPSSTLVGGNLADPNPRSRVRQASAFASDTIGLFDDHVLVTGGLRLQTIVNRSYDYATQAVSSSYDSDAVTPVVGVVVKPVRGLSLFANRIESLAAGPTAPVSGFYPDLGTLPVSNAGTVFAPYRSVQYEAGGKLALGRVNASVALFQTTQPIGQVGPDPANAARLVYGLFGEQRDCGVEISADGEVTKGLRVIAGASFLRARLRHTPGGVNEGNKPQGVPGHTANANVEWDLPFVRGLTLTSRATVTGGQYLNIDNTLRIPSWTTFDAGARFVAEVASRPVTFRAGVDNLADRRYWASAYDSFSQTLLQGSPRTFKASASIDF